MPKRTRSHQLEDLSRSRLHNAFEEAGWTAEDLAKDYGEDLLIRIFERGRTTPIWFFVQIKATDRIGTYASKGSNLIHYPVKASHLIHWRKFQQPVIVTLWDAQSDKLYWNSVHRISPEIRSTSPMPKKKTVRIPIPRENLINAKGLREIRKIAYSQYAVRKREAGGLSLLIDVVQARLKKEIEYSSNGIIRIGSSRGGEELIVFGEFLRKLTRIARIRKTTLDGALRLALDRLIHDFHEYERSGEFPVRNSVTGKIERKNWSIKELRKYFQDKITDF